MLMCFTPEELAEKYVERKPFEELEQAYNKCQVEIMSLDKAIEIECPGELYTRIWKTGLQIQAKVKEKSAKTASDNVK